MARLKELICNFDLILILFILNAHLLEPVLIELVIRRYPQPPFEDTVANGGKIIKNIPGGEGFQAGTLGLRSIQAGGKSRIHCIPNPCTLKINEVVVGVTSTDALFHISSEETNANLEPGSRLRRISQHLLQQRSFYPLFPPPANMPANLDLKQMKHWERGVIVVFLLLLFVGWVCDGRIRAIVVKGRLHYVRGYGRKMAVGSVWNGLVR